MDDMAKPLVGFHPRETWMAGATRIATSEADPVDLRAAVPAAFGMMADTGCVDSVLHNSESASEPNAVTPPK